MSNALACLKIPIIPLKRTTTTKPHFRGEKNLQILEKVANGLKKNRILFRGDLPRRRADTFTAGVQARRLQPESDPPLINSARNDVGIPIAPRNLMRDDLFFQKCSDLLF